MIKQLLTAGLLIAGLSSINAQELVKSSGVADMVSGPMPEINMAANKTNLINVQDTLYYFQRKNYYRNVNGNSYFIYKTPYPSTVTLTEFGNSFLNGTSPTNGATITIFGAYFLSSRQATSPSTNIPVKVTLYSASPTGVPGASLASAMANVTSTAGVYAGASFSVPVQVTGAFFISYMPQPIQPGDTMFAWYNNGATPTSTLPANQRYGENLAYIRSSLTGNTLQATTNFLGGTGAERESIIVPVVSFNYTANAVASTPNATAVPGAYCQNTPISYTNTTDNPAVVENRQFNYNKFRPYWSPFSATVTIPAADSIYNWSFTGPATPSGNYTTKDVSHTYATGANASSNLIVKYQKMSGVKLQDVKTWTIGLANCGIVGVNEQTPNADVSMYPNPVISGKTTIHGLQGMNTISIHNILGQVIYTESTEKEAVTIDLSNQAPGTYMLHISDA